MDEVLCGFQLRENHRAPPEMVLSKSKSPSGGLNLRCTVMAAPPVRRFGSFSHICAIIIASSNATPVFIPQAPPPSAVASPSNSGTTPQTRLCLRSAFRRPTRELGTTNLPRRHLRQSPCCSRSRDHSTFTRPRIAACCGHAVQDARHSVRAPVGLHNNQLGGVTVSIYYYHLTLYYFYYLILCYSQYSPNVLTFCFLFSAFRLFHSSYCFFFLLLAGAITTLTARVQSRFVLSVFCSNLRP